MSPPFDNVMGPPLPNESRLMRALRLLCCAECQSCKRRDSSAHQRCNPIAFYLSPVQDINHNQSFAVEHTGDSFTLTSNVTFETKTRPKKPRADDQEWHCPSEPPMCVCERAREIFISPWLQVRVTGPRHHLAGSLLTKRGGHDEKGIFTWVTSMVV